jgi:hypothetical protein
MVFRSPYFQRAMLTPSQMIETAEDLGETLVLGQYPEEIDVYKAVLRQHNFLVIPFPGVGIIGPVADAYDRGYNRATESAAV